MKITPLEDGRVMVESICTTVHVTPTSRVENGFLVMGGRSVETFPNGRTEVREWDNCRVGWTDGSPFTTEDAARFRL